MARVLKKPWLEAYRDYTSDTENPLNYNTWCGISALSSSLKRNVFVWYQNIQYYPNQYIVLVGPPGIGKGRAMRPALEIAEEAKSANFLYDRWTAEKIIERIAEGFVNPIVTAQGATFTKEHVATIVAKELPNFLGASDWMHTLLCQLWDENRFDHQTKNKGSNVIKELCVGLLGGCVPEYIRNLTKDKMAAVTGGFTSRTIFVYASEKSKKLSRGWGAPNGNKSGMFTDLVTDLNYMRALKCDQKIGMTLTKEAEDYWDIKYDEYNTVGEFESDALKNFNARVPSHVIKTAISLSVSESDNLIITKQHLEQAAALVEEVRDNVDITFRAIGESPLAVAQDKVMRFIQTRGLCTRSEILRYCHRDVTDEQLSSVLKVLLSINFIAEKTLGKQLMYEHNRAMKI
jgi:hypothetical protein